jgi:DNA-3-methyladenine glycosylase II
MLRHAVRHLRKSDPVLRGVIDRVGPCRFTVQAGGSHFDYLVRSIVYQQLSTKAAATIHARVVDALDGPPVRPDRLVSVPEAVLRRAGLSRQKLGYLRDLGRVVEAGLLRIERIHDLDDEEVTRQLVQVKGVGRWTAQMVLIFRLGRPDVLPDTDLGVQKGVQLAYRLRKLPKPDRVAKIAATWAPYRSIGSWYMWRLLDRDAVDRKTAAASRSP